MQNFLMDARREDWARPATESDCGEWSAGLLSEFPSVFIDEWKGVNLDEAYQILFSFIGSFVCPHPFQAHVAVLESASEGKEERLTLKR